MERSVPEFEAFAAVHAPSLFRLAFLLCGDYGRAEDFAQEALERVFARWNRLDDPLPYARKIVVNATRDRWRRIDRHEHGGALADGDRATPENTGEVDDRDQLMRVLRRLPHGQRAVVVLRYWHDLSEHDTALALNVSVGTVKSQSSRALQRLRLALEDPCATTGGDHV